MSSGMPQEVEVVASMKDVASYAGVSVSTVSRTLSGYPHVSDAVRERVLQVAEEMGYRANAVARAMRSGQSRSLGLIVRDMESGNFAKICAAAEATASARGYDLYVCNSERDPSKERRYIESLLERRVDGLILFTADDRIDNLDLVADLELPVALVSSRLSGARVDRVDSADQGAAEIATAHLLDAGHRRVAFLAWGQEIPSGRGRLRGYMRAMQKRGVPVDQFLVRRCGVDPDRSYEETSELLSMTNPPTALLVSTTDLLVGALGAIVDARVDVPAELSIVAFDDSDAARVYRPRLTVMQRDVAALGSKGVELVLDRIIDAGRPPRELRVPFELLSRDSVAPPAVAMKGRSR